MKLFGVVLAMGLATGPLGSDAQADGVLISGNRYNALSGNTTVGDIKIYTDFEIINGNPYSTDRMEGSFPDAGLEFNCTSDSQDHPIVYIDGGACCSELNEPETYQLCVLGDIEGKQKADSWYITCDPDGDGPEDPIVTNGGDTHRTQTVRGIEWVDVPQPGGGGPPH